MRNINRIHFLFVIYVMLQSPLKTLKYPILHTKVILSNRKQRFTAETFEKYLIIKCFI